MGTDCKPRITLCNELPDGFSHFRPLPNDSPQTKTPKSAQSGECSGQLANNFNALWTEEESNRAVLVRLNLTIKLLTPDYFGDPQAKTRSLVF